jgi:hypothetical protein
MVSLAATGDVLDVTTFCDDGWREYILGLRAWQFGLEGFWQSDTADAVDPESFAALGTANRVMTVGIDRDEADPVYMSKSMQPEYRLLGEVGAVAPFYVSAVGSSGNDGVVRGQLAVVKTTVTTTGAKGTALNLGLVGAGQYLYSTLHLMGTPGSSITCVVESDVDDNWSSATTRIAFGAQSTADGFWGTRLAGAIADDDWFRLNVTAITGSWDIACAIGIQ